MRRLLEQRFREKVQHGPSCWLWLAGTTGSLGYGSFWVPASGRMVAAHRVSWELTEGPIPEAYLVLHHCDTPPCVRPSHLFLGTQLDNMRDMVAKRRNFQVTHPETMARGESHGAARLTAQDVREIRAGAESQVQAAQNRRLPIADSSYTDKAALEARSMITAPIKTALVKANNHPIGWGGFILATAGIIVPSSVDVLFLHLDPAFRASLHVWGRIAAQVGVAAAFVGRAPQVPS